RAVRLPARQPGADAGRPGGALRPLGPHARPDRGDLRARAEVPRAGSPGRARAAAHRRLPGAQAPRLLRALPAAAPHRGAALRVGAGLRRAADGVGRPGPLGGAPKPTRPTATTRERENTK